MRLIEKTRKEAKAHDKILIYRNEIGGFSLVPPKAQPSNSDRNSWKKMKQSKRRSLTLEDKIEFADDECEQALQEKFTQLTPLSSRIKQTEIMDIDDMYDNELDGIISKMCNLMKF